MELTIGNRDQVHRQFEIPLTELTIQRARQLASKRSRYPTGRNLLATVLLITAIGQRFHFKTVRIVFMILAWLLLCLPFWQLLHLPRI